MLSRQISRLLVATLLAACAGCSAARAQDTAPSNPAAPSQSLAQYEGQYRSLSDPDQITAVYLDGGALYEESELRERQRLLPAAASDAAAQDRFRIDTPKALLTFQRDASGSVSGLKITLDDRTILEASRISTEPRRLNHARQYAKQLAMVPMRDGVHLHAVILRPAQIDEGEMLPFLIVRTPYGVDDYDSRSINRSKPELAVSGYIFVYEDIRGRYRSEGKFVMNRPIVAHKSKKDVDETTDTYDTVDWLLKNVPGNNGRVGVFGVSYDGFLAMMAGIDPHPAVKAISPQAPMTDVWLGDDFFHNGAFRQSYGLDYVQQMEAQKTDATVESKEDTFDFFLKHGNFAGAAAAAKMSDLPTAKAFLTEPTYTRFWQEMAVERHLNRVEVPTLEVGGYWDQEDMWGTQAEYAALKPHDTKYSSCSAPGTTAAGSSPPGAWARPSAPSTSAPQPGPSIARPSKRPSSRSISKTARASTSPALPASAPA